ncbi:hypothetical protein CDD80_2379 [Ophiocordyceps camponoti-rufipedis]|uniref:DUF7587 domain-containing protein n=1 Tax=Ophiocordyceps camponoti-rufipedis TaxID=2004952 RepID=A0A2C5Z5Z1_9HYPO|nr:hypothetical protein CDD80_2379 [Ophiocordyceps camponoti-rufipedis]
MGESPLTIQDDRLVRLFTPAQRFYRVQTSSSLTVRKNCLDDFHAAGGCWHDKADCRLSKTSIERHLDINDLSYKHSHFISLYDNLQAAQSLAHVLRARGHTDIVIAVICIPMLRRSCIPVPGGKGITANTVFLPVLDYIDRSDHVLSVFSVEDARKKLGVSAVGRGSEWLAIGRIPREFVKAEVSWHDSQHRTMCMQVLSSAARD